MGGSESKQSIFTIADLAAEFGITPRAIRYYEEMGLLSPQRSPETQQRLYDRRDCARLKLILRGRRFGFGLKEIGELLDLYDVDTNEAVQMRRAVEYGDRHIAEIDEMIRELEETKAEMLEFRQRFDMTLREMEARQQEGRGKGKRDQEQM
ncbi:MAG: MerR family transcriptional regulator [Symbiobacteriia bacterium]